MSIASEITRLQGVKSDILQAINDKGVSVPAGSALDDCPALIASIPTGAPDIPEGYKQSMYLELNGATSWGELYSQPETESLTGVSVQNVDTFEIEMYLPNNADFNYMEMIGCGASWTDGKGYTTLYKDKINCRFMNFRELAFTGLDNLGKFLSIKRSARYKREGESTPSGYNYIAQFTLNGTTTETDQYGDLQGLFCYNVSNIKIIQQYYKTSDFSELAGLKIFRVKITKYLTGETLADIVPCVRNSDSKAGFMNLTTGQFIQQQYKDTTLWTAGPLIS